MTSKVPSLDAGNKSFRSSRRFSSTPIPGKRPSHMNMVTGDQRCRLRRNRYDGLAVRCAQTQIQTAENGMIPYVSKPKQKVIAGTDAPPIVILPGFGNNTTDYTEPFGDKSRALASQLEERGWRVFTVDLERKDWFKVARALATPAFWRCKCTAHQGYRWYLDRVHAKVQEAKASAGCDVVDLVGHSAGGWLARAYVADPKYFPEASTASKVERNPAVRSLVSLGAPHLAPPKGVPGVFDATRGALRWLNEEYPGAFFDDVNYVTVAGRAVVGKEEQRVEGEKQKRSLRQYAYSSYQQVCGAGEVDGDCVVPKDWALLEGANQIVLDGVFHSMSKIGTYDEAGEVQWYGSSDVVDIWLEKLV
eukprot:CAMPEP_0114225888 /NCGR_PEP_ID=MMETSP0058-20121206/929_1 /TAXON_ID=36894 /ORGANISM="Pyramimonas parkeae, CCMP726" /LENGTH=361 /DNA_ID=CAMNT_0001336557 /DNA_START=40 /DNA_END=1125 /DNA_ORIENTATION=+